MTSHNYLFKKLLGKLLCSVPQHLAQIEAMVGAAIVVGHGMWTYTRWVSEMVMAIVGTRGYRRRVTAGAEIGHFCLLTNIQEKQLKISLFLHH
jgi:hypothetical protein